MGLIGNRTRRDDPAKWSPQMENISAVWTKPESGVPETRMDPAYPAEERSAPAYQPVTPRSGNARPVASRTRRCMTR